MYKNRVSLRIPVSNLCVCVCVCVCIVEQDGGCKVTPFIVERSCFFSLWYDRKYQKLIKKKNETKNDIHELTTQREAHRLRKQAHGCQGEGIVKDLGKVMCTLLHLKWINNKNLLNSTWDSAQCYALAWMAEGVWERISSVQFTQSCPTLCSPMDCSMPGFPVYHPTVYTCIRSHVYMLVTSFWVICNGTYNRIASLCLWASMFSYVVPSS